MTARLPDLADALWGERLGALLRGPLPGPLPGASSGMPVSRSLERLRAHYRALRRWAARHALVGPAWSDPEVVWTHYADALTALELLSPAPGEPVSGEAGAWAGRGTAERPDGRCLVDVGSGAGFPGLVLAAVLPDLSITLVEPRQKKVAFLRAAVREMGATDQVTVLHDAVRSTLPHRLPMRIHYVTLRALKLELDAWSSLAERLGTSSRVLSWGAHDEAPILPRPYRLRRESALPSGGRLREYELDHDD